MPDEKTELHKVNSRRHNELKGKLVEVRRIGANPIFIEVLKSDTIKKVIEKADIPTDNKEVKVEGLKPRTKTWKAATLSTKAYQFDKLAVTTKVKGN